ncbi:MAG: accessory gene regulator B family protein [Clostridia bacterium]|nr:accessory gene regulator B family protein [Clostridia bacterium]
MVDKICDYLTNKIRKENSEIDDERAEVINYGIHLIVGEIPKFFIIMGIAYLLGVLDLTILAYFLMLPYRGTSGGFHLKTHIGCIIGTVIFFSGTGLLGKYLILAPTVKYIVTFLVWAFGMIMVKLYAPADTENIPIISKNDRKKKRILSYITLTLSIIASLIIKDIVISNIIVYGMLLQSISITRFAYKLTNNKYGYELYNTQEELV